MDRCVCCGKYVPEGSMVCSYCIQDNADRSAEFKRVIHGYWQPNVARKRRKDPMAFCSNCNYRYHQRVVLHIRNLHTRNK